MNKLLLPALLLALPLCAADLKFKKLTLSNEFWCEGAHFADFDQDGSNDICAGPFVWWGPGFKERSAYNAPKPDSKKPLADEEYASNHAKFIESAPDYKGKAVNPLGYSDYFLTNTHDFNADGKMDILVFSWPGDITAWYEIPASARRKRGSVTSFST